MEITKLKSFEIHTLHYYTSMPLQSKEVQG